VTFERASKAQSRLRLAFQAPAGHGKTFTALLVATELAGGHPFTVVDSEYGSASKYADKFTFDGLELAAPFDPEHYIAAIDAAEQHLAALEVPVENRVLVIDSLTHAWKRCLDLVDTIGRAQFGGNSYAAWSVVTPRWDALIDRILASRVHVIATMRSKSEYVLEEGRNGRTAPRKVGMAAIIREGVDFEFDLVGELDKEHTLNVTKSRCEELDGAIIEKPGAELAQQLRAWLTDGVVEVERTTYEGHRVVAVTLEEEQGVVDELLNLAAELDARETAPKFVPATTKALDKHREAAAGRLVKAWAEEKLTRARAAVDALPELELSPAPVAELVQESLEGAGVAGEAEVAA
jgi:hypothetical protein